MTTAAPPEKMTLEPCPFCRSAAELSPDYTGTTLNCAVVCLGCHAASSWQSGAMEAAEMWNRREAARRLSAPAPRDTPGYDFDPKDWGPSAPAGGGGSNQDTVTQPYGGSGATLSAPAPAAPRVGDAEALRVAVTVMEEIAKPSRIDSSVAAELRKRIVFAQDWLKDYVAALSAPPAASADEREDDLDIDTRSWEEATTVDDLVAIIYSWPTCEGGRALADKLYAAGYRKRAAQGVATLEDIKRWCEQYIEGVTGPYGTALLTAIDALSALPKSQDDEG